MRNTRLLRTGAFVAAGIVTLGALAYAIGGAGNNDAESLSTVDQSGEAGFTRGAVDTEIASAIGGGTGDGAAFGDDARAESLAFAANSAPGIPGSEPAPGGALVTSVDRKIISTASIQLQVDNVGGSFEEVSRIATSSGGFVASSNFSYRDDDSQIATVTIRVPTERYQNVLVNLRNLGVKVDGESSDTSDVTEQYTDLASRLRTLEATETQLLALLEKAVTITDILTVQDRLNFTRSEIEQIQGRMQLLDDLTDLATITVHLRPVVAGNGGSSGDSVDLGAKVTEAWDDSMQFLGDVAGSVISVVVFAWWVPIAGAILLIAYKAVSRNRPEPRTVEVAD